MRRTQITGVAKEVAAESSRTAIRDLIMFDLKQAFDPDDLALAEKRVAMFNHAPMLLAIAHAVWGVGLIIHCLRHYSLGQMLLPVALLLLLLLADGALALLMRISAAGNLAAHHVTRGVCVALGLCGLLWMAFTGTAHGGEHVAFLFVHLLCQLDQIGAVIAAFRNRGCLAAKLAPACIQ